MDRSCQCDSVAAVQYAVTKLYRFEAEIKTKAQLEFGLIWHHCWCDPITRRSVIEHVASAPVFYMGVWWSTMDIQKTLKRHILDISLLSEIVEGLCWISCALSPKTGDTSVYSPSVQEVVPK